MSLTRDQLEDAIAVVRRTLPVTPSYAWPLLAQRFGAEVWVKHENHLPVGAFKVRGGLVYVDRLRSERPQVRRLVSATRGNHGQSIALAGTGAGLEVTIVVPYGNSPAKNTAMRSLGAILIEHGADFQDAREHAASLADSDPASELVPSFHPDLVRGVATYAAELFDQAGQLDTVYVPVGMGSGICGLIGVRDLLGLRTEIVGVVASNADATARSFEAGHVVTTDSAATFVDGVATRSPDPTAIDTILAGAARVLTVDEDAAADAMRLVFETTHNLPEPAGSLAFAGLTAERELQRGRRVAAILTGGNVDAALLQTVLAGGTPSTDPTVEPSLT